MPRRYNELRWTLDMAAKEFGVDPIALRKKLIAGEHQPGEDEKYSTRQIAGAIFDDLALARLRNVQLEGDLLEMEKAEKMKALIKVDDVRDTLRAWLTGVRQIIRFDSRLTPESKEALLSEMREIDLTAKVEKEKEEDDE